MIKVYSAKHPAEAEYLHNMLTSHHIHSHLSGSFFLKGVTDGLPAHDMVGLYTDVANAERAWDLIQSCLTTTATDRVQKSHE